MHTISLKRKYRRYLLRPCRYLFFLFLSFFSCPIYQWPLIHRRIGIVPIPIYGLTLSCLIAFITLGQLPKDISVMMALLAVLGFTCAALGARIPGLNRIGGPVIVTTFLSSCLLYYQLFPTALAQAIVEFWHSTNVVYLFIASVAVGSVLSMERRILVQGFIRIFLPLATASVVAAIAGTLTGMAFGMSARHTFFYIVIPIMAGGVGEGAIPLTLGYSEILHIPQGPLLAQVMPAVVLGNLTAILCVSLLKHIGKRYPHLNGQGHLTPTGAHQWERPIEPSACALEHISAAGMVAISLYMSGVLIHQLTGLPAPVAMLFIAVLARVTGMVSPNLEDGSRALSQFFSKSVTYPLLFAIGVTLIRWDALLAAFSAANLVIIVVTVIVLTTVGFFMSRWVGLYAVEGAIVTACHSGMGGIGDVAILTAADRMQLMPFAQIATRIGGAITITVALILFSQLA